MTPEKIYTFQDDGDRYWYKPEEWETPPLTRVEYIRKDTLLEWAKEKLENMRKLTPSDGARIYSNAINDLIDKLNQM